MNVRCAACQAEIPDNSQFCGFCGFRRSPISEEEHRKLSDTYRAVKRQSTELAALFAESKAEVVALEEQADLPGQDVIPLTRKKNAPPRKSSRQLLQVPDLPSSMEQDPALAATLRAVPEQAEAATMDTLPAHQMPAKRAKRYPLKVEVSYTSDHNFYSGFVEDLGAGGLFVATHQPISIGEDVEVTFTVPGLHRICTALCRVCWERDYNPQFPDMVPGMGLKFTRIEPEVQAAIDLFIRHRDPIFYDDD